MEIQKNSYDFGIIGNCQYSALISKDTNITWMCWPRFDSSFIFGSLLDREKGGGFSIMPTSAIFSSTQKYIKNTNVLVTKIECPDGIYEVTDFAPRFVLNDRNHKPLMLFRKVKKLSGTPQIIVRCRPTGKYGATTASVLTGSNHLRYEGLDTPVRLTTNGPLTFIEQERPFHLNDDLYFVLSWGIPLEGPLISSFDIFLNETIRYWQIWVEHCTLPSVFQKEVIRSALTLKLHQFEDTGGIVASCTTSLPEIIGKERNWDYRYCWLRDSYYTLHAFQSLGRFEEIEAYSHFIENLNIETLNSLQPAYSIDGSPNLPEKILDLEGYRGHKPVRIGNEAAGQVQNDAYGQVLLTLHSLFTDERVIDRNRVSISSISRLLSYIERTIEMPDNGVWEFRNSQAIHTYSLLFCTRR